MTTIYCFITGSFGNEDLGVGALAEDGTFLASHISSSEWWAKQDIGYESNGGHSQRRRDAYAEKYPDGYELVWVDRPAEHEGVKRAEALNAEQGQQYEREQEAADGGA